MEKRGQRLTVGELQKLLSTVPDSVSVRLRMPAGMAVDRRHESYFDLHVDPMREPTVFLGPHEFDPAQVQATSQATTSETHESKPEPKPYSDWRSDVDSRAEDAAYWFGYYLMRHSREEGIDTLPDNTDLKQYANVTKAVDTALHNALDLLEGFYRMPIGDGVSARLRLVMDVVDDDGTLVESHQLAPGLDLPIGFWKFADGDFR